MSVLNIIFVVLLLFFFGLTGLMLRKRNIILILVNIELLLVAVNFGFFSMSSYHDEISGQVMSLFILAVAAAEAALGLALLIAYYRLVGGTQIETLTVLKG